MSSTFLAKMPRVEINVQVRESSEIYGYVGLTVKHRT